MCAGVISSSSESATFTRMPAASLRDAIATIQAGTAFMEGGVDYRGAESVGGHDTVYFSDGAFHYETEQFHAWGSHRDQERKEHEVFDTVDTLLAFLESRPALAEQLLGWHARLG